MTRPTDLALATTCLLAQAADRLTPTAAIRHDGHRFYISYLGRGTRSRKDYKTEAGARRIAISKGEVLDPAPAKYVLPIYLDPTSETYRCA
jgi:hypothetical protein